MDTPNELQTMEPKSLEMLMAQETEKRATLQKFISNHLVDGTDYGVIKIGGRDSKPCLFKPGSEKFCSLLQLRAEFSKDEETISMLSDAKDTLAYVCRLIHNGTGQVVAEGRGACALKEKQGSVNTTIKIAEKRAQIDAVLRLGFSDSFTQDLEDMPEAEPAKPTPKAEKTVDPIKAEIMKYLHGLGLYPKTADETKARVKTLTQLDLAPENYEEICNRFAAMKETKA